MEFPSKEEWWLKILTNYNLFLRKLKKNTGSEWLIVKAQIHAGGRGKGGGVKLAKNDKELYDHASSILGMMLKTPQTPKEGKLVKKY